jgi:hypothetical protein
MPKKPSFFRKICFEGYINLHPFGVMQSPIRCDKYPIAIGIIKYSNP